MSNQELREKVLSKVFFRNMPRCGRHALIRVWRRNDGMAATEFGILAPLLILMYLGTVEVSRAIDIDRQFTSATAMAAAELEPAAAYARRQLAIDNLRESAHRQLRGILV